MFSGCSAKTLNTSEPNYWKKQRPRSTIRHHNGSSSSKNPYKLENAALKIEIKQLKHDLESMKSLFSQLVSKTRKLLSPSPPKWLSTAKAQTAECRSYLTQLEDHFNKSAIEHVNNSQRLKQKLSEVMEQYCMELEQENANLRQILGISRQVDMDVEQRIRQLETEYQKTKDQLLEPAEQEGVKEMLEKAVGDALKRKEKKENEAQQKSEDVNDPSSHLLPNKEAAHKNMKPKTAYLLGSPDSSDEEEDEEEQVSVVKNVESKYLL